MRSESDAVGPARGGSGASPAADNPGSSPRFFRRQPTDARTTAIADGFWCLRLPLQFVAPRSVNAYLLAMSGGYCLIDCGTSLEPTWEALTYALSLAGVSPDEIRLLLCTHLHADHAGLSADIVSRTGCRFARGAGPDGADHLLRDPGASLDRRRELGLAAGIPPSELAIYVEADPADDLDYRRAVPDQVLAEGDEIETALGTWCVVPAPGHAGCQILLFNRSRRWLIMADLAYESGEPFFEYGYTSDPYADHLASLDRAEELDAALAFAGHGRVVESPGRRIALAREAALASGARVRSSLSQRPASPYEISCVLLGDRNDPGEQQSMVSVVLCVLEHLEARGLARGETGPDRVRRWRAT